MHRRLGDLHVPAVAGGLTLLGGMAMWQLGIEFERAWMQSYDGPLLGEGLDGEHDELTASAHISEEIPSVREHRRWVARHHPRALAGAPRVAWSSGR
jgi:hypothetical protein